MNHVDATVAVKFSNEYARFNIINGNRQLNEKKIKKILAEISQGNDMLKYYPIQVIEKNERLDILDGQHRFYISKKLKRPVYYILVSEQKSMMEIARINSNSEKWKAQDFLNCYIQFDNKNYKILQEFMDTYGINLGSSLKLLNHGHPGNLDTGAGGNRLMDEFQNGEFVVNALDEAVKLADTCQKFHLFTGWKSRSFVVAIHNIIKANLFSVDDILKEFHKRPDTLLLQRDSKSYIYALEVLVNVGKKKRIIIA